MLLRTTLLFSLTSVYFLFATHFPTPPIFELLNITIAFSALLLLFMLNPLPTSLHSVFYVNCIIFFAIAPRIEISQNIVYWLGAESVFKLYEISSLIVLLSIWLFHFSYFLGLRSSWSWRELDRIPKNLRKVSGGVAILVSSLVVFAIYYLNDFSAIRIFFRGVIGSQSGISIPQSLRLIYETVIVPIPSICYVAYMMLGRRRRFVALTLLLLMIVGNPITGFARWQGSMLYIAALLATFPSLVRMHHFVSLGLFSGLFLIFPLLDFFRLYNDNIQISFSFSWIYAGHLDTFQNFARALEIEYVSYGNQLLGVLLFFVPRSIWADKPISSGHIIAGHLNLDLDNISMNILGEGYMNFGLIGIFLFVIFFGVLCGLLDKAFWRRPFDYACRVHLFYLFFLGGSVFVFRGPLMSALAYTVGTFIAITVVLSVTQRKFLGFK